LVALTSFSEFDGWLQANPLLAQQVRWNIGYNGQFTYLPAGADKPWTGDMKDGLWKAYQAEVQRRSLSKKYSELLHDLKIALGDKFPKADGLSPAQTAAVLLYLEEQAFIDVSPGVQDLIARLERIASSLEALDPQPLPATLPLLPRPGVVDADDPWSIFSQETLGTCTGPIRRTLSWSKL
jgi:hypothetical protein